MNDTKYFNQLVWIMLAELGGKFEFTEEMLAKYKMEEFGGIKFNYSPDPKVVVELVNVGLVEALKIQEYNNFLDKTTPKTVH